MASSPLLSCSGELLLPEPSSAPPKVGFFDLPGELRLDIYEFCIFSTTDAAPTLPCPHSRMRLRSEQQQQTPSPRAVDRACRVSRRFGAEFAVVYYEHNRITLFLPFDAVAHITCTNGGVLSGGIFPRRTDYALVRVLDVSVYLESAQNQLCQWCYWADAKAAATAVRSNSSSPAPGAGGDEGARRTCSRLSLPSLRSLHVRFVAAGDNWHYLPHAPLIARCLGAFAAALPPDASMSTAFFTGQGRRNYRAESLFTLDQRRQDIEQVFGGKPLWFQCDPPGKLGGEVQRWLDEGTTYFDMVPRFAKMEYELLQREGDVVPRQRRDERERLFRRRHGRAFDVVVLEVWGRDRLEDWGREGERLKGRFDQAVQAGLEGRQSGVAA